MPRIGSLTQSPRQPTMRRGASIVPLAGHGRIRLEPQFGREYIGGPSFGPIAHFRSIGHRSFRGLPLLKKPQFTGVFTISGVSRDDAGATLAFCDVRLFKADAFDQKIGQTTSDGSGNYTFTVPSNADNYWIAMYKGGTPVAGVSGRDLVAV